MVRVRVRVMVRVRDRPRVRGIGKRWMGMLRVEVGGGTLGISVPAASRARPACRVVSGALASDRVRSRIRFGVRVRVRAGVRDGVKGWG